MGSIPAISAVASALSQVQLKTELQVRVLAKQQEVMRDLGDAALKLIQSAQILPPHIGRNLDIRV